jgi:di/tricarboxylate transporter
MNPQLLSLIVLLAMFVVASFLPVNLGVIGFVAAFLVGTLLGGLGVNEIFVGFPGNLFILLAGVTFLFAIAESNGTIDLVMRGCVALVRGRVSFIPVVMFALTALVTGAGALSSAGVAIVAPTALQFAARYGINPLLMGVMVVQGATAGSYSPISAFGMITNGVLVARNLPQAPGTLFVNSLIFNAVVAALVFAGFALAGRVRDREDRSASTGERLGSDRPAQPGSKSHEGSTALTPIRSATLLGIMLLVLALGFQADVGFVAFTIALGLVVLAPGAQKPALARMPWPAILLICGILTYVAVQDKIGTIDYMQGVIARVGSPIVAALAASYVAGVISAFASTAAILGALIPLAEPILRQSGFPAIGTVTAIAISAAIVDISPLSTNGALLIANAHNVDEQAFLKQLLLWSAMTVALAPLIAWLVFVVIAIP